MSSVQSALGKVEPLQRKATAVALVGIAALIGGFAVDRTQFFASYLQAYILWLGPTLGCLAIMLVANLTGAGWAKPIRHLLTASYKTLPLMVLLFIPILLGVKTLYPWTHPDLVQKYAILQTKTGYLNLPFFFARTAFYFLCWAGIAFSLRRWIGLDPKTVDTESQRKIQLRSALGLLLYVATLTFAAVDWVMSLDPFWASSAFGLILLIGEVLSSFCFIVILMRRFEVKQIEPALSVNVLHDYGNFMLMAVMFWTYISISQALIIWSGNLPEELTWYYIRVRNGWQYPMIALIFLHFALPFLLLLSRIIKRRVEYLAKLAVFIVCMRAVEIFWVVSPNFHEEHFHLHWMDVVFPIAFGGLWLTAFFMFYRRPLVPAVAGGTPLKPGPQDRYPLEKKKR